MRWRYGLGVSVLLQLKPWAVMQLFSMPPAEFARHATPEETPPLDLLLQRRAAAQGMAIFGLESASEQIALFDDLPVADQIALLEAAMVENARINWWWTTMKEAYLARDVGAIYQAMSESWMTDDPELVQQFQERVIDQRNERMVARMMHRLAKGKAFIASARYICPASAASSTCSISRATRSRASIEVGAAYCQAHALRVATSLRPCSGAAAALSTPARRRLMTEPKTGQPGTRLSGARQRQGGDRPRARSGRR